MVDVKSQLASLVEHARPDLVMYFETLNFGEYACRGIGLLPLTAAVAVSEDFRSFHPLAMALGLVVLDDADTSNHHCYISRGPLAGSILFLGHDDNTRVVFKVLEDYLNAVKSALANRVFLDDCHFAAPVLAGDQEALSMAITSLLKDEGDENAMAQLLVYIQAMDLLNFGLLEKLARHSDMYVAEALGNAIARQPRPELTSIARLLSEHRASQAASAGKRALAAIRRATRTD